MMNRGIAAAAGIALFAAGIGVGLLIRERSGNHLAPYPPPVTRTPSEEKAAPDPRPDREADRLQRRVQELEVELARMRERSSADPRPDSPVESPELLFRDYVAMEKNHSGNTDPDQARLLFGRLSRLDEKQAAFFIQKFRQASGDDEDDERSVALELALACGGPDAAEFIHLLLNDPTLESIHRENLLREISGLSGSFFAIKRLPVNEALSATAMALSRSGKAVDRQGGAGLLGGVRTEASRTELCRLLEQESDFGVKTAAALSLGHVGDPATRSFLESYWRSTLPTLKGQDGVRLRKAVESALKELAEGR